MSEYFRMSLYGLCLPEAVLEPDCPVPSRRNHHSLLREGEDCNWIRRPMFQPWCSFKVCNNGERSITDVLISSTQMTQLQNNWERLWALSPAQLHWCRQEKAKSWRRKQVNYFQALPLPVFYFIPCCFHSCSVSPDEKPALDLRLPGLAPHSSAAFPFLWGAVLRQGRCAGCSGQHGKKLSSDTWGSHI